MGGWQPGIDEMQKSEIEKRKRSMESISRISRREKRNVEICFLVPEEKESCCTKKSRNLQFSLISRREREILKSTPLGSKTEKEAPAEIEQEV